MSHLRLLPKPLAKCGTVRPYAAPMPDGLHMRAAAVRGRWLLAEVRGGRFFETKLTLAELRELHRRSGELLAEHEETDDVDDER